MPNAPILASSTGRTKTFVMRVWKYTHATKDHNHIARVQREQGYARPQQYRQGEGNAKRALVPTYLLEALGRFKEALP